MFLTQKNLKGTNLVELLGYRAEHQPEQTAYTFLVDGETEAVSITYQELEQRAKAIAAYVQTVCLPGERALLIYPPSLEYIAAFFGCLYAGVIAVPAYPPRANRSLSRLDKIIENSQATLTLTNLSILPNLKLQPELGTLRCIASDNIENDLALKWRKPLLSDDSVALLQYTSGSTTEPKGVAIAHRNLLHNSASIYQCFEHTSNSTGVIWLPPYHDMGLIGGIIQPLYGGFPVVLMSPLMFLQSPIRWLQAISKYRATTSGGPNFAYDLCTRKIKPEQLAKLDLSSWNVAFVGAEPINYDILERFATTFAPCGFQANAFYPCYGMAEATLIISGGVKAEPIVCKTLQGSALEQNRIVPITKEENNVRKVVGCGSSLLDQQIAIVHPQLLTKCLPQEVGEIWVSGPSIALGYWNQPEQTKQTFCAYIADTKEGPFLRTGDLGFWQDGELFVTGRLKDVIIINGRNYYPQDIEWTIEQTHSQIKPNCAAAFCINIAGEEKLAIAAEVERSYYQNLRQQAATNNNLYQQLIQSIKRVVSQHYDLQVYSVVLLKPGSIPKTSSGKIQRYACRASFLAGSLETLENLAQLGSVRII